MTTQIPDKLYFKIGEVSKLADVAPHVLRYWETEFSEISPKRANSRQRLYRREDVILILRIKDLLHKRGYTINGARKLIKQDENPVEPSVVETNMSNAVEKLGSIKSELKNLQKILSKG